MCRDVSEKMHLVQWIPLSVHMFEADFHVTQTSVCVTLCLVLLITELNHHTFMESFIVESNYKGHIDDQILICKHVYAMVAF